MQVLVLAFLALKPNPNLGQENPDLDVRNPPPNPSLLFAISWEEKTLNLKNPNLQSLELEDL